jgi:hypothetical protein
MPVKAYTTILTTSACHTTQKANTHLPPVRPPRHQNRGNIQHRPDEDLQTSDNIPAVGVCNGHCTFWMRKLLVATAQCGRACAW